MIDTLSLDYSLNYAEKCEVVEEIVEAYFRQHEQTPPPIFLEQLSDYLLSDILLDKNPAKASKTAYPILSSAQLKRRNKRLYCTDNEDVLSYFAYAKKRKGI